MAQPAARGGGPAVALGRHLHVAPAPLPVHRLALRLADRPRLQPQHARRARQRASEPMFYSFLLFIHYFKSFYAVGLLQTKDMAIRYFHFH